MRGEWEIAESKQYKACYQALVRGNRPCAWAERKSQEPGNEATPDDAMMMDTSDNYAMICTCASDYGI